ncbi:MAG: cytochrome B561 [Nitrospirae bacterium]|nr:MAG: cytochrome B561 [Nitrospirota bacterium]
MSKILVWDIPNRIFHWLFAGSIAVAMTIAFLVDDEQPLFQMHMLLGIVTFFMLLIRLVMGIVGSRYSRFSSYPVHPRVVIGYMFSAVFSKTKLYAGNNPGSAVAAVLMFVLVPALFISGIGYSGEAFEELHELLAKGLLAVVILHIAGLTWHTIRHRENISLAMITGRKAGRQEDAISSAHPIWGGIVLLASVLWITALFAGYSPGSGTVRLPVIGVTLQLGDNESDGGHHERGVEDDD